MWWDPLQEPAKQASKRGNPGPWLRGPRGKKDGRLQSYRVGPEPWTELEAGTMDRDCWCAVVAPAQRDNITSSLVMSVTSAGRLECIVLWPSGCECSTALDKRDRVWLLDFRREEKIVRQSCCRSRRTAVTLSMGALSQQRQSESRQT